MTTYAPASPPVIPGSERLYLNNELKKIARVLEQINDKLLEIQAYIDAHP